MPNDNTFWDDEDDESTETQPQNDAKSLRAYARKTEKENKELRAKLAEIEANTRKSLVAQTIKDKGLNPKIAAFVPESIGSDSDAITRWLDEYKDVFTFAEKRQGNNSTSDPEDDEDIDGSAEVDESTFDRASWERMSRAANSSMSATKRADLAAKLSDPKLTKEDLDQILASLGNQKVSPYMR